MFPKSLDKDDKDDKEEEEVAGRQKELLRSRNSGRTKLIIFNFCKQQYYKTIF